MKLRMINEDGTVSEIEYKPTSRATQENVFAHYLVKNGSRPSEAAMHVSAMKDARLRRMYQNLVLLGEVKQ